MSQDEPAAAHAWSESLASQLRRIRPGMHVLFIDPDVASAQRLASALRSQHTVVVVRSVQLAMAQMEQRVPDLIVTEIDLPDANGLELVARWRGAPATRHTLLMIVTTRRSVHDKITALEAGADAYLIKPVELTRFLAHTATISRFRQLIHGPLYR